MQPCTEARPATVGSTSAIRVRNGANELNGATRAAIFFANQEPPIAGRAQIGEHGIGDLAVFVEQRAGRLVALHGGDRIVHHLLHVGRRLRRRAHEQFDRHAAVPHRPMRRAVHRLILRARTVLRPGRRPCRSRRSAALRRRSCRRGRARFRRTMRLRLDDGLGANPCSWRIRMLLICRGPRHYN